MNKEFEYTGSVLNGFMMLFTALIALPAIIVALILLAANTESGAIAATAGSCAAILWLIDLILFIGFFMQQPNQARVMIFFGKYRGTFKGTGFYWVNPFMNRKKLSLRLRNMDIEPIKVNDKIGNPVLIGMVLVWKIKDTYKTVFDVDAPTVPVTVSNGQINQIKLGGTQAAVSDALEAFVRIQSDAALREVTGQFAYDETDTTDKDGFTLRSGGAEINDMLEEKINERLAMAGIEVVEARLNYLAYAPEIAAVMLRRQQATAIITAREKIVEGAVSMVKMALDQLKAEGVVELDDERRAAMVSNLMVVLCADEPAQPVLNTGSLYQ